MKIVLKIGVLVLLVLNLAKEYLIVNEIPQKVDIIVVYSGDSGERTEKGIELLRKGYAEKIIFSGGKVYQDVRMADLMKQHAIELGIAEDKIIVEREANSTYENARLTLEILKRNKYKSIIVVTSDYHTRRTRLTTKKVLKGSGIECIVVSTESNFTREGIFDCENILIIINEYLRILGYMVKGRII